MATSGTFEFNPSLGELVLYAYQNIGVRPTSILQEHMQVARTATNMMLSRWANQGVNLWAVDLQETPLLTGVSTYNVDPTTIMILDTYVVQGGMDRIILPISTTEYASLPNKEQIGSPTSYWFDRLLQPIIILWPVPNRDITPTLKYYRVRRLQDANLQQAQNVEIPYEWLEAFSDGLIYRLARIWNPQMAPALKGQADESYQIAAARNTENVQTYVSPSLSVYWRQ
jgi:hypothetical protein